jgi:ATP-dependent helicase HrpB
LTSQIATEPEWPDLPVLAQREPLRAALARGHAVLSAAPGSGKTTLVPLLLRDEAWLQGRRIVMLEPRRPAARMAAHRMAQLLGEPVGASVGYQVRFERRVSAATRVEVVTEGVLLRRLQADPELADTGLLVFDEFHERSLNSDLALALALDVARALREDLRLLVMSASLDAAPVAHLLDAPCIEASGRQYPVETRWAARDAERRDPVPACLALLCEALRVARGDVLVFLPGRREIEAMRVQVEAQFGDAVTAVALYGELPTEAQDRVLRPRAADARRRVIIATDIAETSLTIDGVDCVVDSGLARKPVFEPGSGLTRLETGWISRASALQRGGRAGRLGPGWHFRAWTPARDARLEAWRPAEILTGDLAGLVLQLAAWGLTAPEDIAWLDAPPTAQWQQALDLLRQLHAVDGGGRVTVLGRRMSQLPLHPRLARLLASANPVQRQLAADIAALLSERDPLRGDDSADIELRLDALQRWRAGDRRAASGQALRQVDRVAAQLRKLAAGLAESGADADSGAGPAPRGLAAALALAYPDRVAATTGGDGRRYRLRHGRAVMLGENDPLRGESWLAVASVDARQRDGVVWLAAALDQADLERLFEDDIVQRREVYWDAAAGDVVARVVRRLDALLIAQRQVPLAADDPVEQILCARIREQGLAAFGDEAGNLRARVQTARRHDPEGDWPDLGDAALLAELETWLVPWLKPGEGVRQLRRLRLDDILAGLLGWDRMQRLERGWPAAIETPAGTRRKLRYAFDADPVLAVPLQEMLGLAEGPKLMQGRVAVTLELLSPAGRPLQVTSDLASFWQGAYDAVKKEMRGRYPKHHWPDDPATARATRFTRRRRQD